MNFSKLLQEGRVDDFKSKYGNKFSQEQLKRITDSVAPKYLMWVGKVFDAINFDENFPKLYTTLNKFSTISSNLPKTDINQYSNLDELANTISIYENRERRDVKRIEGGNVVFDDGKLFVVNPLDYKSSCYYGRGTKWCTAAETDTHFQRYNQDGKLFYIIDRTKPTSDPLYKVALLQKFNGEQTFFDAKDEYVKNGWIFNTEEFKKLINAVNEYLNKEYSEQIKIFTDKELEKKERERLRKLEIQRILHERMEEANIRRANGEWDLNNDPSLEGLKAHALLEWLENNGNVEVLTNDDRANIQRIKDEIERLREEDNSDENLRTDLLTQIDDLEDELADYDDYVDVYNIIPTGDFYHTTEFEVINSGVDDNRYAVGTDEEMQRSCEEYVDGLIDDIGYEGFNSGFAKQYLDIDKIIDYAEDLYGDDVRETPEAYFDESEREISYEQEENIELLEKRIENVRSTIDKFESQMGGENDEWYENKIDELNERISEYEEQIEEIRDYPEGDFPEEMIEDRIHELVSDVKHDPEGFLSEFGLDWGDFIDKDEFIQGVIDADGYGHTLNGYDGNADEIEVDGHTFYVMRID